jgi:hypothetical protein
MAAGLTSSVTRAGAEQGSAMKDDVDLFETELAMERLDALYRPIATRKLDRNDPFWTDPDPYKWRKRGERISADFDALGVADEAESVLRSLIAGYESGDEAVRVEIRSMFDRYRSFRWAAHLPREWHGAAEFRARLILFSARDQGTDTRDEILTLWHLRDHARADGVDVEPILMEVATMSSTVDRYGMGSMRDVILTYGRQSS